MGFGMGDFWGGFGGFFCGFSAVVVGWSFWGFFGVF